MCPRVTASICSPTRPIGLKRFRRPSSVVRRPSSVVPVDPAAAWSIVGATFFPELGINHGYDGPLADAAAEDLRSRHYNATITSMTAVEGGPMIMRVCPDAGRIGYRSGDFASIGLGLWEPRVDEFDDVNSLEELQRMVHRSYAISSPIFTDRGYLADPANADELEFYLAVVPSSKDRMSSLTPRRALFKEGDRIYVGPGVPGRYVLYPVTDPFAPVFLLSTGTGEAPHVSMIVDLLRSGHQGPITLIVASRHIDDLLYLERLRSLETRYANLHVVTLTGKTGSGRGEHIQDFISSGTIDGVSGGRFDPADAHVYVCGNPAMVGAPTWKGTTPVFPDDPGVAEMLVDRGFTLDRLGAIGNVHTEVFW
jgi:ferredoxin--NADP+ reductase